MFRLITLDMDGTLLTSAQTISKRTSDAIHSAVQSGKTVALCTGRSVSELVDYVNQIPDVRYAICVSGGLVYDLWEKCPVYRNPMSVETVRAAIRIADAEAPMIQFLETELIVEREQCLHAELYHMGEYRELFDRIALMVEDIHAFYESAPFPVAKMNLYHKDTDAKERNRARLLAAGLPITIKDAEITSLELSDQNVNKGEGLRFLCRHLNIDISETISVGDAANDMDVLKTAGFPIAMGNAWQEIKNTVLARNGKIVSDNDHDGCAEAIEQYLLS